MKPDVALYWSYDPKLTSTRDARQNKRPRFSSSGVSDRRGGSPPRRSVKIMGVSADPCNAAGYRSRPHLW
jgi:hypothetical protein